jgi:hypothetical protein
MVFDFFRGLFFFYRFFENLARLTNRNRVLTNVYRFLGMLAEFSDILGIYKLVFFWEN